MRPSNTQTASTYETRSIVIAATLSMIGALVAISLMPANALAAENDQEESSLYLEYMVGISHVPNQDIRGDHSASILFSGETEQEAIGYFVGAAVGKSLAGSDFGTGLGGMRAEIQVGFRSNEIKSLSVQGEPDKGKGSTVSLFSAMANLYFDFDLGGEDGPPIVPWIGAGIGWGMPSLDAQNSASPMQLTVNDKDSVFVYNVMAGATYPISKQAALNFGYRYIATPEFDVRGTQSGLEQRFEYNYSAHEFFTGIRFLF